VAKKLSFENKIFREIINPKSRKLVPKAEVLEQPQRKE
jgi:hypothetical protein